jgi:hypothetical protein
VSPEQKSRLETLAASARNSLLGIPVKFRAQDLRACISPVAVSFDLESGGLRQGGEFTVRFQASDLESRPRRGESIQFHGRSYLVQQVGESLNNPAEYTCTVSPAGGGQ